MSNRRRILNLETMKVDKRRYIEDFKNVNIYSKIYSEEEVREFLLEYEDDFYIKYTRENCSYKTYDNRMKHVLFLINYCYNNQKDFFDPTLKITRYFYHIQDTFDTATRKNDFLIYVRNFSNWLKDNNFTCNKGIKGIDPVKVRVPDKEALTEDEVKKMFEVIEDLEDDENKEKKRYFLMLLITTGMRLEEAITLKFNNFIYEKGQFKVKFYRTKKRNVVQHEASLIITEQLFNVVRKFGEIYTSNNNYILTSRQNININISKRTAQYWVEQIAEIAQIDKKITPHLFRTTAATLLNKSGYSVEQICKFLGHSNILTTMRYIKPTANEEIAEQANKMFSELYGKEEE